MATAEKLKNTDAAEMGRQIEAAMRAERRQEIGPYKPNGLIASNLGPCRRERVLGVLHWDMKPLPDEEGMERMAQGSDAERRQIARLLRLGFEIVEGQRPFEIKSRKGDKQILRGRIDGRISVCHGGRAIPFEHKFWSPHVVDKINSVEDFARYEWTAKALRQLQVYMYAFGEPDGLFILWDGRGFPKCVAVPLDYEMVEKILTEAEADTEALVAGTPPDFCEDKGLCRKCWARGVCCNPPGVEADGAEVVEDEDLLALMDKRAALEPAANDYEATDKMVKDALKARGKDHLIVGGYDVRITSQQRKTKQYSPDAAFELKLAEVKVVKIERVRG